MTAGVAKGLIHDSRLGRSRIYGHEMPETVESMVEALRDLIEVVRTADLCETDLGWATESLRDITTRLEPSVVPGMRMQHTLKYEAYAAERGSIDPDTVDERAASGDLDPEEFFPYSPLVGRLNPISPPVRMWRATGESEGEVHGEARFRSAYNGPPGSVHGGVIAATFDELLGATAVVNGLGAFTGTLSVVYKSLTPLHEKVNMRAWVAGTERRKVFIDGELRHGDTLCAIASGIFIRSEKLSGLPGAS